MVNRRVLLKILVLIGCIASLLLPRALVRAQTTQAADLRVIPPQAQVAVGQTVDVAVEAINVDNLYAIDLLLAFDPAALEVVDMDPSLPDIQVSLGTLLEPGFVILNLVDNGLGRLRLVMTQLAPATPKSGSGTLMVVRFQGKQAGPPAAVTILSAQLASPQGQEVPLGTLTPGQVQVVQTVSGPSPTAIPSQAPGTPMPTPPPPTALPPGSNQPAAAPTATRAFLEIPPTALPTLPPPPASPTQAQADLPTTAPGEAASACPLKRRRLPNWRRPQSRRRPPSKPPRSTWW